MKDKKQLEINVPQLVSLACNLLQQAFLQNAPDRSKQLFKQIKKGKKVSPGNLTVGEDVTIKLELEFDGSEFKGGMNYPAFETALKDMIARISEKLNNKADLNIMTSETNEMLINQPGIIQHNEQVNLLMMSLAPRGNEVMAIRLMFIDPEQFVT